MTSPVSAIEDIEAALNEAPICEYPDFTNAVREVLALARQAEALQQEVDSLKQTRQHSREASAALHDAFMEERKRVEALQRENAEFRQSLSEILETAEQYWANPGEISEIVRARALLGGENAE